MCPPGEFPRGDRRPDDRELPRTAGIPDVRPHLDIEIGTVTLGRIAE